jgi:hypothetical protein
MKVPLNGCAKMNKIWLDGVSIEWKVIGLVLFQMEKVWVVLSSMVNEREWIYCRLTHNKLCNKMGIMGSRIVISHLSLTCLANFIFETLHGLGDGYSNLPHLASKWILKVLKERRIPMCLHEQGPSTTLFNNENSLKGSLLGELLATNQKQMSKQKKRRCRS